MKHPHKQRGVGLIIFLLVLILAGSVFLLTHIEPKQGRTVSEANTSRSLATAKQVLLAYASSYYLRESTGGALHLGRHGILPCPEQSFSTGEGVDSGTCGATHESSIGRLPWASLDISPLKDAAGECLWYAVSGGFFNSPASPMTNDDTPGMFQVFNQDGTLLTGNTPENRVVAVIIAPGKPLSGQTRVPANTQLPCHVSRNNVAAADYLDSHNGINNAVVDTTNPDRIEAFITSPGLADNPSLNDRIITITTDEIFDTIKRIKALYDDKIGDLGDQLGNCLITYAQESAIKSCATLATCKQNCTNTYDACILAAGTDDVLIDECEDDLIACNQPCRDTCIAAGGLDEYRMPWPAPVDLLAADYRDDDSYQDLDAAGALADGLFGRLPNRVTNSSAAIGIADTTLFESCNIDALIPAEMHTLWQHWKDHWFYVVGREFSPTGTNGSPCANCPQVDGGPRQSALLIFSAERLNNQLRRSNQTEVPDPVFEDSKADIRNYLEGNNSDNYSDSDGDKDYGINNVNDRLFCIAEDFSAVSECTP